MPNYLLWGADPSAREAKAQELLQDHFIHSIEAGGKILPVKEIRPLLAHWHLHPLQPWKRSGLLVLEAQRMNEEVQNTLLKTLEEPPSFFTFVFTVPHPKLVLPTVTSRCLIQEIRNQKSENRKTDRWSLATEIFAASPGERLAIFEEKIGYNREPVRAFLDDLEHHLSARPTPVLKEIWETKKILRDDSTNLKTAVDHFLLSW